jgi:hypothetical protein
VAVSARPVSRAALAPGVALRNFVLALYYNIGPKASTCCVLVALHANVLQISHTHRLAECFRMLTDRSARLLNLPDYGIAIGNPADLVVIDASSPEQAVSEICQPLVVFKRGRRTVTRHAPQLHYPA